MRKITLKDIAQEAGVSATAVSLAMRGSGRISNDRTQKIQQIAERLGYARDPMMSALCAYRDTNRPRINNANIYFLQFGHASKSIKNQGTEERDLWNGALKETKQLGYSLNKIWVGDPSLNPERIRSILKSRGVAGLIVYQANSPIDHLKSIFNDFSVMWLGDGPKDTSLHSVRLNRFSSMKLAWENLSTQGYQTGGLVFSEHSADQNYGEWDAAHSHFQRKFVGRAQYIPPLTFRSNEDCDIDALRDWLEKWKPQVIISAFKKVYHLLQQLDLDIPNDIGYLALSTNNGSEITGIDQEMESISQTGIRLLDQLIRNREQGIPKHQQIIETNGQWNSGETLKSQS